jgi:hypothetical protein
MSHETAAVLRAARAKVAQGFTQHAFGRNALGAALDVEEASRTGVCWCTLGALNASGAMLFSIPGDRARQALRKVVGVYNLGDWNDAPGRTQAEVLAAFDRAIAAEESANG